MYLSELKLKNFRCFDNNNHTICFNQGLTVLVGENDSGKSAIIDAICIVFGTTDFGWHRIEANDFHNEDTSLEISITCKLSDLSAEEQAAFLECLTYENVDGTQVPCLYLHWKCKYLSTFKPPRPVSNLSTGKSGGGPTPAVEAKELLRTTFLRALRDAYSDMQSGRNSRLSQIIQNIPTLKDGTDNYAEGMDFKELSLVGITELSNKLLAEHHTLKKVTDDMTDILCKQLLLKNDTVKTCLEVAGSNSSNAQKIQLLLEKLDLSVDKTAGNMNGRVGLGTSNILSMACEMLLHKESEAIKRSSFLLIEEPEAHVHAQRQLKLIQSLESQVENKSQQVIMTTHSPLLTSVVKLENIIIVKDGQVYPLAKSYTLLEDDDYKFLEKYLDATKSNLFFARSVIIVEGPGEALLLPTLAKLLDCNFTDFGTSLVDVRSTGLRRYARIFQRKDVENQLQIKVACITDQDIMPDCGPRICIDGDKYTDDKATWPELQDRKWRATADFTDNQKTVHIQEIRDKADGQQVKTFISDHWTLEYNLAYSGFDYPEMLKILVNSLVKICYVEANWETKSSEILEAIDNLPNLEEKACYFYRFFVRKNASKADFAQQLAFELEQNFPVGSAELKEMLPSYLVDAITYVTKE